MNNLSALFQILVLFCVIGLMTDPIASAETLLLSPTLPHSAPNTAPSHQSTSTVVSEVTHKQPARSPGCSSETVEDPALQTLTRVSGEDKGPRIPDPMVFDLIRPLGAKRGEAEVNILGLVPLRHQSRGANEVTDPLGLVRRSPDREHVEWAPEIEYAVCDGVALEFEVPMENSHVEAYKAAGQITFGTGLNHRFIHGAQTIVQYGRSSSLWTTTLLYLAGFRFDETWSVFSMIGGRAEVLGPPANKFVELLSNVTLFADVTDRLVAGIEANLNQVFKGNTEVLFMPQLHYEVDRHWMIQAGVGARFTTGFTLPQVGFRLIREF